MSIAEPFCKTYLPRKVDRLDRACDWNETTDATPTRECDESSPVTFFMHGKVEPVDNKASVVTEFRLVTTATCSPNAGVRQLLEEARLVDVLWGWLQHR